MKNSGRFHSTAHRLYRKKPFDSDRDRVEHLFGLYEKLVNPIEADAPAQNRRVTRRADRKARVKG